MLNRLTPEVVNKASDEIKDGTRIPTDLPLDFMSKPCFGRAPFQQTIKNKAPRSVNGDTLIFNTQISTQWDGFRVIMDTRTVRSGSITTHWAISCTPK